MIRHGKTHAEAGSIGGRIGGRKGGLARSRRMTKAQKRAHCARMRAAKEAKRQRARAEERRLFRKLGITLTRARKTIGQLRKPDYGLTPSPSTRDSVEQFLSNKAVRDAKMVRVGVARL